MNIIKRIYNKVHNYIFRTPVAMSPGRELNVDVKSLNAIDNKYIEFEKLLNKLSK